MANNISENHKNSFYQLKKNTVSSSNQLKENNCVKFFNLGAAGKRIMFVGNSITLHGINTDIGWNIECGMAASKKENDYVHVLMSKVDKIAPNSEYCICQVAEWEGRYKNGEEIYHLFGSASDFSADIIIIRLIENCPTTDFDSEIFKKSLYSLIDYLDKSGKARIIITTSFWKHPGDKALIEYAKENNLPCIELGDLGEQDEMKAIGLFEHEGVANHPGDFGMKNIADRIFAELEKYMV